MWQKSLFCSVLINATFLCQLSALTDFQEETAGCSEESMDTAPHSSRITMRHIEGKGIGYNQGYTTVEGFFVTPSNLDKRWIPFLDLRGHIFNDGEMAANAGLGVRHIDSRVSGINAYYDYRKTDKFHYNQLTVGLESLGTHIDYRINGYFPLGEKSILYSNKFDSFQGNSLILSGKREFCMTGGNAEVGVHITKSRYATLYSAIGPYFFNGENRNAYGGEFRIALDVTEYLRIEGNTSYDNVFKGIVQGQLSINIPLGKRKAASCAHQATLMARALSRVDRNEIVVVDKKRETNQAIDPTTGNPYLFIFVNNTSHSSGTFESPYTTLAQAEANSSIGDVIYVDNGDGSAYNTGIRLKDRQLLLSSAVPFSLNTTVGPVTIPISNPVMPTITTIAVGTDVVNIANDNTISGFIVNNTARHGISSALNTSAVSNVTIAHNRIEGSGTGHALHLHSVDGDVVINANTITGQDFAAHVVTTSEPNATYSITDNTISTSARGIHFDLTDSFNVLTLIENNKITTTVGEAVRYIQDNTTLESRNTLIVHANHLESNTDSISSRLNNFSVLKSEIQNNTLIATTGNCIESQEFQNGDLTSIIANNEITAAAGLGVSHTLTNASKADLAIERNHITSDSNAVKTETLAFTNLTALISDNTVQTTTASAIVCTAVNGSGSDITINDNTIAAAGVTSHGITLSTGAVAGDHATTTFVVERNKVTAYAVNGLSIATNHNSVSRSTVRSNTFPLATPTPSVHVTNNNAANSCLTFQDNVVTPTPPFGHSDFHFDNISGTFKLVSTRLSSNVGQIVETGTITSVTECP